MIIKENILPQLEFYRFFCNFLPEERKLFDLRANGRTLDECCSEMDIDDISSVKRLSARVNRKIDMARNSVDMEKWIKEHYQ